MAPQFVGRAVPDPLRWPRAWSRHFFQLEVECIDGVLDIPRAGTISLEPFC
jgi:hypothetical protein